MAKATELIAAGIPALPANLLADDNPVSSIFNGEGVIPASESPAGFAITSNYSGYGEVDFWNTVNNDDTDTQGFAFNQKTGASTYKNLVSLFSTSTYTELDMNGVSSGISLYASATEADIGSYGSVPLKIFTGAAADTLVATFGATGGFTLATGAFNIPTSTPASAAAAGVAGTIAWDADFIYVCVSTNTWKKVAIATWA